jgi:hypothetical protein
MKAVKNTKSPLEKAIDRKSITGVERAAKKLSSEELNAAIEVYYQLSAAVVYSLLSKEKANRN